MDRTEYKRKWYLANRERILAKHRRRKPEILTAKQIYFKNYYLKNRERLLKYSNDYNKLMF